MNEAGAERILVCISPSPSNQRVVEAAATLASAFRAPLTAIYVRTSDHEHLDEQNRERLAENIRLAESRGASVATIAGEEVPVQIAEFARISGTTKIVLGRSSAKRQHFWSKSPLTEQLISHVPDVDVYIIPDSSADIKYRAKPLLRTERFRPLPKDLFLILLLLAVSTGAGLLVHHFGFSEANIITIYILGVLITSAVTVSPLVSGISSLLSVVLFNYFFIEPVFSFHTYETEYAVTFAVMFAASLITGTLANRLKESAKRSAHEAYRAKILFDTNQLLQKAKDSGEVVKITAEQIIMLLRRVVIFYPGSSKDEKREGIIFRSPRTEDASYQGKTREEHFEVAINNHYFGAFGIRMDRKPLETFETGVLMSIIGECAMALESLRNAEEKERAAVMAQNEQLRANLLRTISHDIRTPLTTISGNAGNLLRHEDQLEEQVRRQIYADIYDDSQWLINLVENLLSISRIENGQMNLHLSTELVGDVIEEALRHLDRNYVNHKIETETEDELILAKMDSRLIAQVLINLVNNAIKNTQAGSTIKISCKKRDGAAVISVTDDGPGIPDEKKPHVFEMFYTASDSVADGRRGMGLGLALCRSIIEAHGGTITLTDNIPHGCSFTFELPIQEVEVDE